MDKLTTYVFVACMLVVFGMLVVAAIGAGEIFAACMLAAVGVGAMYACTVAATA